jgi:hypothetical protein
MILNYSYICLVCFTRIHVKKQRFSSHILLVGGEGVITPAIITINLVTIIEIRLSD